MVNKKFVSDAEHNYLSDNFVEAKLFFSLEEIEDYLLKAQRIHNSTMFEIIHLTYSPRIYV